MTEGTQVMLFSTNPDADRAFARDLFGLTGMDAGASWLVFALPPGQSGMDDFGSDNSHQLYLECRNLDRAIAALGARGVDPGTVTQADWGRFVSLSMPGGAMIRLHERSERPA